MTPIMLFQAIRVFFLVRALSFTLLQEIETQLPLTKENDCVKVNEILDLSKYKASLIMQYYQMDISIV